MRNRFRMTPLIVGIIGVLLTVGAGAAIWFLLISPANVQLAAQQATYDANKASEDPVTIKNAENALVAAKKQAAVITAQWTSIQRMKNPTLDFSDRYRAWGEWLSEANYDFAPRLNAFLHHTGITPLTAVGAPPTYSDPNAVPSGTLAISLGQINVAGSYQQILNHIAAWNRFDRIVVVDGLGLNGYSPFMTGSYTATEYIFTTNSDKPGPPVPSPGASGAQPPKGFSPSYLTTNASASL